MLGLALPLVGEDLLEITVVDGVYAYARVAGEASVKSGVLFAMDMLTGVAERVGTSPSASGSSVRDRASRKAYKYRC